MRSPEEFLALAEEGVKRAESRVDHAEVFVWSEVTHKARVAGETGALEQRDVSGVSVRVLSDGRLADAGSSGCSEEDIAWVIDRAAASAGMLPRGEVLPRFADPQPVTGSQTRLDPALVDPDSDRILDLVAQLAEPAEGVDRIDYAKAGASVSRSRFAVANSSGVATWDENAYETVGLEVRARFGDQRKFLRTGASARGPVNKEVDVGDLGAEAVNLISEAGDPKPLDEPVTHVIFDRRSSSTLLGGIVPSLAGSPAKQGRTKFHDKMGERVVSEKLTFRDAPQDGRGIRNQRIDDEGIPTKPLTLIEDGTLVNYLYDWRGAVNEAEEPTGHGLRPMSSRYTGSPGTGTVNLRVDGGDRSLDELVEEADRAVLVRGSTLGSFTTNRGSGDFSFVVPYALYIEDGEIQHPLVSASLAGNIFDALEDVVAVGSKEGCPQSTGCPPISVGSITCAT